MICLLRFSSNSDALVLLLTCSKLSLRSICPAPLIINIQPQRRLCAVVRHSVCANTHVVVYSLDRCLVLPCRLTPLFVMFAQWHVQLDNTSFFLFLSLFSSFMWTLTTIICGVTLLCPMILVIPIVIPLFLALWCAYLVIRTPFVVPSATSAIIHTLVLLLTIIFCSCRYQVAPGMVYYDVVDETLWHYGIAWPTSSWPARHPFRQARQTAFHLCFSPSEYSVEADSAYSSYIAVL